MVLRQRLVRYIALASTVTRLLRKSDEALFVPSAQAFVPNPSYRSFGSSSLNPIIVRNDRRIVQDEDSIHRVGTVLHLALNDAWEEEDDDEEIIMDEASFTDNDDETSSDEDTNEDAAAATLWKEFQRWQTALDKTAESLERKKNSLSRELERSNKIEETKQRADLLKNNLYLFANNVRSAMVQDWETGETLNVTVDASYDSATAEVEALFGQIRKLKRGAEILEPLIQETIEAILLVSDLRNDLQRCVSSDDGTFVVDSDLFRFIQDRLLASKRTTGFKPPNTIAASQTPRKATTRPTKPALGTPASNVRKLSTPNGCTVLVGRNRRGNDFISMKFSKGHDIWMHARGTPGAHVVVPNRRGTEITDDCMQFAADLAAFYSDHRTERNVDVTMTYAKHISKPRNAPMGAVKTREEVKVLSGRPGEVPEELKQARSVSGLSDEYRAADKAKLRQMNKANAKKMKESKKRAKAKARQEAR